MSQDRRNKISVMLVDTFYAWLSIMYVDNLTIYDLPVNP